MRPFFTSLFFLGSLVTASTVYSADDIAVTVNGEPIYQKEIDYFAKQMPLKEGETMADIQKQVKDSLVNTTILRQMAVKQKLSQRDETQLLLKFSKERTLAQAFIENYLKERPVSDAALKLLYEEKKKEFRQKMGPIEYKVRHILIKVEDASNQSAVSKGKKKAEGLIKELHADKGKSFAQFAQKYSDDLATKDKGGELGWVKPNDDRLKSFATVLRSMKKGQISHEPVQTPDGWHVIKVEELRDTPFPVSFEAAKPSLRQELQFKALQRLIDDVVKKAKIVEAPQKAGSKK